LSCLRALLPGAQGRATPRNGVADARVARPRRRLQSWHASHGRCLGGGVGRSDARRRAPRRGGETRRNACADPPLAVWSSQRPTPTPRGPRTSPAWPRGSRKHAGRVLQWDAGQKRPFWIADAVEAAPYAARVAEVLEVAEVAALVARTRVTRRPAEPISTACCTTRRGGSRFPAAARSSPSPGFCPNGSPIESIAANTHVARRLSYFAASIRRTCRMKRSRRVPAPGGRGGRRRWAQPSPAAAILPATAHQPRAG